MFIGSKYDSFTSSIAVDVSGRDVDGVHPEWSSASITWYWEPDAFRGYSRAHFQYDSGVVMRLSLAETQVLTQFGHHDRERGLLDASIGVERNGWEMWLWGRNLTNDEFLISTFPAFAGVGQWSSYLNEPRMWVMSLSEKF